VEHPLELFVARTRAMPAPSVLEFGTKRSIPDRPTHHFDLIPHASRCVGTDFQAGADVDIVADVHRLCETVGRESFDVVISCSTFEHFKYPQLAAHQIMHVLKPGGVIYIQTHSTFPWHGFPHDYYRFTREALLSLFPAAMGFHVVKADYEFPCRIVSERDPGTKQEPAFLNVVMFGEKHEPTPQHWVYELDSV
jgi:SAM-dependent methyltransferase